MTRRTTVGSGRDRGAAGSLLMVGVMAVIFVVAVTGVLVGGVILGQHRARSAADLAALSGAAALTATSADAETFDEANACRAAVRAASDNGAELVQCALVGDQVGFVVHVRVRADISTLSRRMPGLPHTVDGEAWAGPADALEGPR